MFLIFLILLGFLLPLGAFYGTTSGGIGTATAALPRGTLLLHTMMQIGALVSLVALALFEKQAWRRVPKLAVLVRTFSLQERFARLLFDHCSRA